MVVCVNYWTSFEILWTREAAIFIYPQGVGDQRLCTAVKVTLVLPGYSGELITTLNPASSSMIHRGSAVAAEDRCRQLKILFIKELVASGGFGQD